MLKYIPDTFYPVRIAICFTEKSFKKEAKRLNPNYTIDAAATYKNELASAATHTFIEGHNRIFIVYINDNVDVEDRLKVGLMTHEAMHVIDFVCEDIGEEDMGCETKAYFIQMLIQQFMLALQEYRRKK